MGGKSLWTISEARKANADPVEGGFVFEIVIEVLVKSEPCSTQVGGHNIYGTNLLVLNLIRFEELILKKDIVQWTGGRVLEMIKHPLIVDIA